MFFGCKGFLISAHVFKMSIQPPEFQCFLQDTDFGSFQIKSMSFWWQLLFRCPFRCKFWELLKWEIYVDVHLMSFLMILLTEQMISISIRCEFWELSNWESYCDVHFDVFFGSCLTEKLMLMSIWCHFSWSCWLSKWCRCQFWANHIATFTSLHHSVVKKWLVASLV